MAIIASQIQHFNRTTFTQPINDQSGSSLLSLPAEIRLMILRYLLTTDLIIDKRISYEHSPPHRRRDAKGRRKKYDPVNAGYKLNPAILASCQLCLLDGRPLLYEENTLSIYMSINSPSYSSYRMDQAQGQLRLSTPVISSNGSYIVKSSAPDNVRFLNFVKLFRRYELQVSDRALLEKILLDDIESLGLAMQELAPIVQAKEIRFVVRSSDSFNFDPTSRGMKLVDGLKTLQFLRCSRFSLESNDKSINEPYEDLFAKIRDVVNSNTKIKSLMKCYEAAYARFTKDYVRDNHVTALTVAASTFDVDAFVKVRDKLVQQGLANGSLQEYDLWKIYDHVKELHEVQAQQAFFAKQYRD